MIAASLLQFSSAAKIHDNKTSHHIPLNKRPPCQSPFPKTLSCMKGGKGSLVFHLLSNRICMHVDLTPKKKERAIMPGICTRHVLATFSPSSPHAAHISYGRRVLFLTQINNSALRLKCSPTRFMAHCTVIVHAGYHLSMSQNARCRVRCM